MHPLVLPKPIKIIGFLLFQDYAPVGAPKTVKNLWLSTASQEYALVGGPKTYKDQCYAVVVKIMHRRCS